MATLDEIAQDPAKTSGLSMDAAEKLLAQAHVAEGALLARLMAARASTDGQLEAKAEEDRWLTPEEAAALLGLTVPQLSRRGGSPGRRSATGPSGTRSRH